MPDETNPTPDPGPIPTDSDPSRPGPSGVGLDSNEAPDVDPPAWEGPDPSLDDATTGLVDPRPEIPGPAGL